LASVLGHGALFMAFNPLASQVAIARLTIYRQILSAIFLIAAHARFYWAAGIFYASFPGFLRFYRP
jgi:hypothetical protein